MATEALPSPDLKGFLFSLSQCSPLPEDDVRWLCDKVGKQLSFDKHEKLSILIVVFL
jgi:hypothetical protein